MCEDVPKQNLNVTLQLRLSHCLSDNEFRDCKVVNNNHHLRNLVLFLGGEGGGGWALIKKYGICDGKFDLHLTNKLINNNVTSYICIV